jgi:hypothetical protein
LIVFWGWVIGISIWPRYETSKHAMDLKVITKAQKVCFAKLHIFWQRGCDS